MKDAVLDGCRVYGSASWRLDLTNARQTGLIITRPLEPDVTVDSIEIAQFLDLLLHNPKVRSAIDAITAKVVLILGGFRKRKALLDAIRRELRTFDLVPVLFDFEPPRSKDLTGTIDTLARLARFIIADISDPASVPHELATVVPFLTTTPVLPLKQAGSDSYSIASRVR